MLVYNLFVILYLSINFTLLIIPNTWLLFSLDCQCQIHDLKKLLGVFNSSNWEQGIYVVSVALLSLLHTAIITSMCMCYINSVAKL